MIFKNVHRVEAGARFWEGFSTKNDIKMWVFFGRSDTYYFMFFLGDFYDFYYDLQKYARRLNESHVSHHGSYMLKGGQERFLLPMTPFWSSRVGVVHILREGPKMLLC